eukprot:scaffold16454_cov117-Isochrysis_galbana.AAC.3
MAATHSAGWESANRLSRGAWVVASTRAPCDSSASITAAATAAPSSESVPLPGSSRRTSTPLPRGTAAVCGGAHGAGKWGGLPGLTAACCGAWGSSGWPEGSAGVETEPSAASRTAPATPSATTPTTPAGATTSPDSVTPDSVTPDSVTPDSVTPDSVTPDSVTPDSVTPDSVTRPATNAAHAPPSADAAPALPSDGPTYPSASPPAARRASTHVRTCAA